MVPSLHINHHSYIACSGAVRFSDETGSLSILFFRRGLILAMVRLNCSLSRGVWVKTTLVSLEEFCWIPALFPHLVDMNAKLIL